MNTTTFDLASLPRVACADFATARRMARRFGDAPRHLSLTVVPFGRLSLTFSYVGPALPPTETTTLWSLRRGDHRGWLSIENIGGLRVVAAMLGISVAKTRYWDERRRQANMKKMAVRTT